MCRNSFLYGGTAGVVTGTAYNLALSRNPMRVAFATYGLVTFGRWGGKYKYLLKYLNITFYVSQSFGLFFWPGYYFQCRYNYRKTEQSLKQIRAAMADRPFVEGTQSVRRHHLLTWSPATCSPAHLLT